MYEYINSFMFFSKNNPSPIELKPWHIILIFLAFFLSLIIASWVKKIYYYFWLKKKYFVIPRPGIKGITNIAMVVSLSVAVLILMTIITSNLFSVLFRAFPGTRVTIEGILIKIGGLLFGPFLGLIIGLLTDLLSVLMTAGIFHYGYFIAALAYGMISGIIRTIVTFSSQNKTKFAIYSTIIFVIMTVITFLFVWRMLVNKGGIDIEFASINIKIPIDYVVYAIFTFGVVSILVIWAYFFILKKNINSRKINFRNKFFNETNNGEKTLTQNNFKKNKTDNYILFCASFTCVVITEMLVNIQAMPFFDAEVTSLSVDHWLSIRIGFFIPMIIFNMGIIFPVYKIIYPLVTYNYENELSKALNDNL